MTIENNTFAPFFISINIQSMSKLHFFTMLLSILCFFPAFSQNETKQTKKPTDPPVSLQPRTIYIIDGVRSDFVYDYTKVKPDEVAYMSIVTDPNEIKKHIKKGENIGTIIIVDTIKKAKKDNPSPTITGKGGVKSSQ